MRNAIMEDPIAKQIAYMLVWRNGGYNHFWVPFRDDPTYGDHEMLPDFVEYYNYDDILFADRLAGMYDLDVESIDNQSYINIDAPEMCIRDRFWPVPWESIRSLQQRGKEAGGKNIRTSA